MPTSSKVILKSATTTELETWAGLFLCNSMELTTVLEKNAFGAVQLGDVSAGERL